jgi:hypothetical protein
MLWFNKDTEKVDETLLGRIKKLENRLQSIEAEILDIATAQNIIRNKVLKKIQFKNPKDDEEEEEKPKDLYNGVLLRE